MIYKMTGKFMLALIILTLNFYALSLPALACSPSLQRPTELSFYDKTQIANTLQREYPELDQLKNARFIQARGMFRAVIARIRFQPHKTAANGAALFYEVQCNVDEIFKHWVCESPVEKHAGYYAERDDFYILNENASAEVSRKIAQVLHSTLVTNELGHFRYHLHSEQVESEHALDIENIERTDQSHMFRIKLNPGILTGCHAYIVEVQEENCLTEAKACDYRIVSSYLQHFM